MSADETKDPTNKPVLLDAIEATLRTIEGRTKILRSTGLLTIALVCLIAGAFYGSVALLLSGGSLIILLTVFGRR